MRVNVEKVLERDKKLTELDDRAGYVSVGIAKNWRASENCFYQLFLLKLVFCLFYVRLVYNSKYLKFAKV